jgi:ubiquinone/menaquinone biosynthesis C-methylase UbiE
MAINDGIYSINLNKTLEKMTPTAMQFLIAEEAFMLENIMRNQIGCELCCGTGRLTKTITPRLRNTTALDYSAIQLDEAATALALWRDKVTLVQGNARNPPLASNWYDVAIISMNTINSLDDPSEKSQLEVLAGCNRLLRKGGSLIFTVWDLNALELQSRYYEKIIGSTAVKKDDCIIVSNVGGLEFKALRTAPAKFEQMLSISGFENVRYYNITNYNLGFIATK